MSGQTLIACGQRCEVEVLRRRTEPADAPRLVIVGFQPNPIARDILQLAVATIERHTPEPHELWVVDNASPGDLSQWLRQSGNVNVIFNHTAPRPPQPFVDRLLRRPAPYAGSHANAVALELAAQTIDPESKRMMTLHMDVMACRPGWLTHLTGHLSDRVRGVGVRLDTVRVRTLHVLGMMFDFTLFRPLGMTFAHAMPHHDVGDGISLALEAARYELWACPNTLHDPSLVERLPGDSPYRWLQVDRSLDDDGEVIFLHLGRGVIKAGGASLEKKTTVEDWLRFGREVVLE